MRAFRQSDSEYAAVADVAAEFAPDLLGDFEFRSGAEICAFDGSFATADHVLRRYVAEEISSGRLVGYAQLFHIPWLPQPGRFWSAIRVRPGWQRRGVGGRLYAQVLHDLVEQQAATVWIMVHETMPEVAARAERAGFRELFRSWPVYLNTQSFDPAPFQAAL